MRFFLALLLLVVSVTNAAAFDFRQIRSSLGREVQWIDGAAAFCPGDVPEGDALCYTPPFPGERIGDATLQYSYRIDPDTGTMRSDLGVATGHEEERLCMAAVFSDAAWNPLFFERYGVGVSPIGATNPKYDVSNVLTSGPYQLPLPLLASMKHLSMAAYRCTENEEAFWTSMSNLTDLTCLTIAKDAMLCAAQRERSQAGAPPPA